MSDDIINVLLLGSFRSGKSGLIENFKQRVNIFSNFGNIDNISVDTPTVEEHTLTIGNQNVRLIDTPVIGHVDGPDKDAKIIKNIFSSISHYKKIHGICIVINISRSSIKYYITQFLRYLHKNAAKNIVVICTECQSSYPNGLEIFDITDFIFDNLKERGVSILMDRTKDIYFLHNEPRSQYYYHNEVKYCADTIGTQLLQHFITIEPHYIEDTLALNEAQNLYLFFDGKDVVPKSLLQTLVNVLVTHGIFYFYDFENIIDTYLSAKIQRNGLDYIFDNCIFGDKVQQPADIEKQKLKYQNQRANIIKNYNFSTAKDHIPCTLSELNDIFELVKKINEQQQSVDGKSIFNLKLIEKILTMKPYETPKPGYCSFCGNVEFCNHHKKCYAKKEICGFCKKNGHIELVCQLKNNLIAGINSHLHKPKKTEEKTSKSATKIGSSKDDAAVEKMTSKTANLTITKSGGNANKQNNVKSYNTSKSKTPSNIKSSSGSSQKTKCYFCGSEKWHPYATCFAKQEICKRCNKKGHIEEACRQKTNSGNEINKHKKPRTFVNNKNKK